MSEEKKNLNEGETMSVSGGTSKDNYNGGSKWVAPDPEHWPRVDMHCILCGRYYKELVAISFGKVLDPARYSYDPVCPDCVRNDSRYFPPYHKD